MSSSLFHHPLHTHESVTPALKVEPEERTDHLTPTSVAVWTRGVRTLSWAWTAHSLAPCRTVGIDPALCSASSRLLFPLQVRGRGKQEVIKGSTLAKTSCFFDVSAVYLAQEQFSLSIIIIVVVVVVVVVVIIIIIIVVVVVVVIIIIISSSSSSIIIIISSSSSSSSIVVVVVVVIIIIISGRRTNNGFSFQRRMAVVMIM